VYGVCPEKKAQAGRASPVWGFCETDCLAQIKNDYGDTDDGNDNISISQLKTASK
jgi:hypothetical protein